MSDYLLYYRYDGEWQEKEGEEGSYKWISRNNYKLRSSRISSDKDLETFTFSSLIDVIYEAAPFKKNEYDIKLSYIPLSCKGLNPTYIENDWDTQSYLMDRCPKDKCRSYLHVELFKKVDDDDVYMHETVYGNVNDDWNGNGNVDVDYVVDLADDYASAPYCAGGVLEKPMSPPISMASAPTPKKTPENVNVEPSTPVSNPTPSVSPAVDSQYDGSSTMEFPKVPIKRVPPMPTVRIGFHDGINLPIGHEFNSKDEVKDLVVDDSIKN